MAVRFEFYISDEDMDRLWAIKAKEGKDELTGNEYARLLLERTINRLHPEQVKIEEDEY